MEELLVEVIQNMRLEIKDLQEQIKEKTLDREVILDSVRRANALVDSMIDGARKLQVENKRLRSERNKMVALVLTHAWRKFNIPGVIDSFNDPVIISGRLAEALVDYDRRVTELKGKTP